MKIWKKLGLLYSPVGQNRHPKLLSHAANPVPVLIGGDVYRIYYSARDQYNRSSVGAVDIDLVSLEIIQDYNTPFFEHGLTGSFYAEGISLGNYYEVNGVLYLLFMGWQNSSGKHWRGDVGRLIINKDFGLELESEVPLMGSSAIDPISLSYPWVHKNKHNAYNMWYGSTLTWDSGNGEMLHVIHHAQSDDGHCWQRNGLAVPYQLDSAQAFSRPTVLEDTDDGFAMWFSYRGGPGKKYRIGYAYSADGIKWNLAIEKAGIELSATGWDSEMIEYPFVFNHKEQSYMLYNGNGYGKTGFGLAVCE